MEDDDFEDDDDFESDDEVDESDLDELNEEEDETKIQKTPQQQLENRRRIEAILERKRMRKDLGDDDWDFEA